MTLKNNETMQIIKSLSPQDFLSFGVHDFAYIRKEKEQGKIGFVVHAADGRALFTGDNMGEALQFARMKDLDHAPLQ